MDIRFLLCQQCHMDLENAYFIKKTLCGVRSQSQVHTVTVTVMVMIVHSLIIIGQVLSGKLVN